MTAPTETEYKQKIKHLNTVIDRQIYLCDDSDDILMFATAMIAKSKVIFSEQIGKESTAKLFRSLAVNLEKETDGND
jgi:hypothetical protein